MTNEDIYMHNHLEKVRSNQSISDVNQLRWSDDEDDVNRCAWGELVGLFGSGLLNAFQFTQDEDGFQLDMILNDGAIDFDCSYSFQDWYMGVIYCSLHRRS